MRRWSATTVWGTRVAVLMYVFSLPAIPVRAQDRTLVLDPAATRIEFTLGASFHTVHGTFQLKSGTIHFNSSTGTASGAVIADATTAITGNPSRDRKMHREVLESQQYPEIVFVPMKVTGALAVQGDSTVQVEGILHLHGSEHAVSWTFPVQAPGSTLTAGTQFTIPYVAWGLKNPSTFLLHVSDKVEVKVTTSGHLN